MLMATLGSLFIGFPVCILLATITNLIAIMSDLPTTATVVPVSTGLTIEQFRHALPDQMKKTINQELIDRINTLISNPDMYEEYRDNLLSYASVMKDGKFKTEDYVNAVKYVSHKLRGDTNIDAYVKTFPDKYQSFLARGVSSKDISAYVASYNKGKLVNLIYEQTMVPAYVLNQDWYQKAINTQAELMLTAKSEKVRSDAANSLLTHLKPPEATKVQLDIGIKQDNSIDQLQLAVQALAAQQRDAIRAGVATARDVAHAKIIKNTDVMDVEAKEV